MNKNKNPFKVGDKVILRTDVLQRHARSVPAHAGYTTQEFQWRAVLGGLLGATGTVSRTFDGSRHTNVDYGDDHGTIGINFTELLPAPEDRDQYCEPRGWSVSSSQRAVRGKLQNLIRAIDAINGDNVSGEIVTDLLKFFDTITSELESDGWVVSPMDSQLRATGVFNVYSPGSSAAKKIIKYRKDHNPAKTA